MNIDELETPSVLIDLDRMERNIERMQALCDEAGVALRPHIKTHKIPEIARMQIEAGAVGIACQKVSEAEVFAEAGLNDILIPYNILGASKTRALRRSRALQPHDRLRRQPDRDRGAGGRRRRARHPPARAGRTGDRDRADGRVGRSTRSNWRQAIEGNEHLHFAGLLVYPSNPSIRPPLQEALALLDERGIGVDTVSGGGTGAVLSVARSAGTDRNSRGNLRLQRLDNGLARLVSARRLRHDRARDGRQPPDRRARDPRQRQQNAFQRRIRRRLRLHRRISRARASTSSTRNMPTSTCPPAIRSRTSATVVSVIPVHTCVVTNLHNVLYGVRGEDDRSRIGRWRRAGLVW